MDEMSLCVERGYLRRLLNDEQIQVLVDYEKRLPDGRFLIPLEVRRVLKIPFFQRKAELSEVEQLKRLWIEFCKEHDLDQGNTVFPTRELGVEWMAYVKENFVETVVQTREWD